MIIEIIATGDEVLTGFTIDTNSAWLSQRLLDHGCQVRRRHTVGDRMDDLVAILQERSQVADVLLVNGGLGPTSDDKTTEAAARAAGVELQLHQEWLELLLQRYAARGRTMPESNRKQAMLPTGASLIDNPVGTACGFHLQIGRARCYFTPGVPSEFKLMVDEHIIPNVKHYLNVAQTEVRRFFTFGVSESTLSDRLDTQVWPTHIDLGYRSSMPIIELKLISQNAAATDFEQAERQLHAVIEPYLIARDELEHAATIRHLLGARPLRVCEDATRGRLMTHLGTALPHLSGTLETLADSAQALCDHFTGESGLMIAVGHESDSGFPILLKDGCRVWVQTLKPWTKNLVLRQEVIAFAASEMLRRYLAGLNVITDYETLQRSELIVPV